MASTFSISSFYPVSQRELFPRAGREPCSIFRSDGAGIGLTITNTRRSGGAGGAEIGPRPHPKYRVESKTESTPPNTGAVWDGSRLELLIGSYFRLDGHYAIANETTLPRRSWCCSWSGTGTGLMSLLRGASRFVSERETHTKPFPVGV
jgi:hypothetical protein